MFKNIFLGTEKTSVRGDNIILDEMFIFETTSDEDSPLSAATTMSSSNNNEEGSGGGQRNNTDYIEESVIPGFLILL